jgi:hypothetical protein
MRSRLTIVLALVVALALPAVAAGAAPGPKPDKGKVEVCHVPPGNPDEAHTISVGAPALSAHLAHGDTKGECPEERPGRVDDDDDSSVDDDDDSSVDDDDDSSVDDDDDSSVDDDDKTSENRAPIARAGADRCVPYGVAYELDGTGSSDPDGDALVFDWDVADHPDGSGLDDGDLSPDDDDDDPTFTPDRLGTYEFELRVTDPDDAFDTDSVEIDVYIDVTLDEASYEVDEDDTVPVKISLGETAPQDVEVTLDIDDDVVIVVPTSSGDKGDEISSVTIDEGDDDVTVYLYGLEDDDTDDEETELTVSTGSDSCGDRDSAQIDVADDDEDDKEVTSTSRTLELFMRKMLEFWII